MRNGQQKRMRGRNRRGQNPMTRVFESNGPDVKVRGTAAHIAEKYVQLARDSQSSGDHVSAENYLQHAEHYFRLIAAAQAQFQQPGVNRPDQEGRGEEFDEDDEPNMPHLIHPGLARLHEPQERPYQGQQHGGQQHQPREHGGQPRYHDQQPRYPDQQPRMAEGQPQPSVEGDEGFGGLPSFITGGGPQPAAANGYEGGNGGEGRGNFRRRRRHRFPPRGDQPGGEGMAGDGPPDGGGEGNG